ncbi:UbiA prenyltransferase family protein [Patescibacteria group bacterium]|nr:UbiA prenyltransferase family protein [Patescibacteria group bacterium]MBU1931130.1 UbiA prenyltransferase family protein [Patescibacteria group bacterium]
MVKTLNLLAKTVRPRQWVKNLALYTGLVLTGQLFNSTKLVQVSLAVVYFTLLSATIYIFNDILDIKADKKHPFKKHRPIAAGELPIPVALFFGLSGVIISLYLMVQLGWFYFFIGLTYLIFQLGYSLWLKHVPILDVLMIASGFILRVYAGAVVIDAHINAWLLLCIISFSLFLAVGKRRGELTLLSGQAIAVNQSRKVLAHYSNQLLDVYCGMFANSSWLTWTLYTFVQPPIIIERHRLINLFTALPRTFYSEKWLMLTIPLVIYGVMRYLQLVYENNQGESPERILLSDRPLIGTIVIWVGLIIAIIYLI